MGYPSVALIGHAMPYFPDDWQCSDFSLMVLLLRYDRVFNECSVSVQRVFSVSMRQNGHFDHQRSDL